MLKTAIDALIPLVSIRTDDLVFCDLSIEHIANQKITPVDYPGSTHTLDNLKPTPGNIYLYRFTKNRDWNRMYKRFMENQACLIVANPEHNTLFFDAGRLVCPPALIKSFIDKMYKGKDKERVIAAFSGLSYQKMAEVYMVTKSRFGEVTPSNVKAIRKQLFKPVDGLHTVNTDMFFFMPDPGVVSWLKLESEFFLNPPVPELQPRGLLFDGPPGTGKTMSAKYIADTLELPLYNLDVGLSMSKWAGESEKNLLACLDQVERYSPAVLLLDEVEKLFSGESDITSRLLGLLLWWLQEHQAKVLTIMTTNDYDKLPGELYRSGRVDKVIVFDNLTRYKADEFVKSYLNRFPEAKVNRKSVLSRVYHDRETAPQADIVSEAKKAVKLYYLKNKKGLEK